MADRLAFPSPEAPLSHPGGPQVSANPPLSPASPPLTPRPFKKILLLISNHQEILKTPYLGSCSKGIALWGERVLCVTSENVGRLCFHFWSILEKWLLSPGQANVAAL